MDVSDTITARSDTGRPSWAKRMAKLAVITFADDLAAIVNALKRSEDALK